MSDNCDRPNQKLRKSRKNNYSAILKKINTSIQNYKRKLIDMDMFDDPIMAKLQSIRFVGRLTVRERAKINELFKCIKHDSYYNSMDRILNFDPDEFLSRNGITKDTENQVISVTPTHIKELVEGNKEFINE
ncbi:MAG: hypothetical protein R3Y24_17645 [Eubacteriales bacterium]